MNKIVQKFKAANARKWKHKDGGSIRKMLTGDQLTYDEYQTLSPEELLEYNRLQRERNLNIAKSYISTPTIPNLYKATLAYFAPTVPENPYLSNGVINPLLIPEVGEAGKLILAARNSGISIRKVGPIKFDNPITDRSEALAALDWFKETFKKKGGRPKGSKNKPKMPVQEPQVQESSIVQAPVLAEYRAPKLNARNRYQENKGVSKAIRTKDNNAKSYEFLDMRHSNAGKSRMSRRQDEFDWLTMLNFGGSWEKKAQKIDFKLKKYEKGSFGHTQAKQFQKQALEEWRNIYKRKEANTEFKSGGKAFVKGVSILDSNPDAYKYVKKKIKKAAEGDNTLNWWLRNSEKINTIGNAISETLPSIVSSILKRKAANLEVLANELSDNLSEKELFSKYYSLEMANSSLSPIFVNGLIINLSPIVALNKAYQVAWNKAKSEMLSNRLKTKLKNAKLYQEANTDLTNSIIGTVGNLALTGYNLYANNKNTPKVNNPKVDNPTYMDAVTTLNDYWLA